MRIAAPTAKYCFIWTEEEKERYKKRRKKRRLMSTREGRTRTQEWTGMRRFYTGIVTLA